MSLVHLSPCPICESSILTGRETHPVHKVHCYGILGTLLDESIPEEDLTSIDRMLRSLRRHQIQTTN